MSRMTRRKTVAALAALPLTLALPAIAQTNEPLKVGFVYVSPIGDAGWTHQHDIARLAMEKNLAGKVTTKYVENVPEGADAERVIRDLAQSGHKLIFTTSFGYMNPTIKVAQQFPAVHFEHATGYKTAKNVGTYNARFYEGRAVCGTIAAKMSKTGVAGYIASFPIPEVVSGINGFTLAARRVNPAFQTKVVWVSSWYDPAKEADAAKALFDQGADVIFGAGGQTGNGALQEVAAAVEAGGSLYCIGVDTDQWETLPAAHPCLVSSAVKQITPGVVDLIGKFAADGTMTAGNQFGPAGLAPFHDFEDKVPQEVKDKLDEISAGLADGSITTGYGQ